MFVFFFQEAKITQILSKILKKYDDFLQKYFEVFQPKSVDFGQKMAYFIIEIKGEKKIS